MLWDVLGGVDTETAYMKDRQPSPGTPLGVPEDRLHEGRTSLPLVPLSEYQRTDYKYEGQAFPWHPSRSTRGQTTSTTDKPSPGAPLGVPEDRLHVGQTKPSPGVPFSGCQRTDYM